MFAPTLGAEFDPDCLLEIAHFVAVATEARKRQVLAEKEAARNA